MNEVHQVQHHHSHQGDCRPGEREGDREGELISHGPTKEISENEGRGSSAQALRALRLLTADAGAEEDLQE